jgi:hypothetical protein
MGGNSTGMATSYEQRQNSGLDDQPKSRRSSTQDERELGHQDFDDVSEDELLLNDPNLPESTEQRRGPREQFTLDDDMLYKDEQGENSPYPEVRAAVRNYDEDLPCNTIRAWTIGLALTFLGASMNTFFSLRQPSISIAPIISQIIAWPIGRAWARWMPRRDIVLFGSRIPLNPGAFNIKEHSIIVVMAGVSFSVAYATDIILAQLVFYKQDFGIAFQLLLTVSTQSLGYGIAGMMRKFLGKSS